MLADVIESTSRALQPNSEKAIEKLVNSLIDEDLTEGQLDESGLTLGDIRLVRESFIKTLKGRFHVRVKYPGNEELLSAEEQAVVETAVTQPRLPPDVQSPLREDRS
jgi:membrane-associated HD superfamily phosphohydrolase